MAVQQGGGGFKPGGGGGFNRPPGGGGGFNKPGGGFNKGGFRGRFVPRKEAEHRINNFIRVPQVRLVGENVEVGVYSTQDALRMAQDQQLDLVEISPTADPPVCKIIDYNKFLYDQKKKEKEMKAKSKTAELKEIRERLKFARLDDKSSDFNTMRIECLELDNLMETAFSTAVAANYRTESRGAHARFDFPDRDDENWLCHSVYTPDTESMFKRKVNMEPKFRDAFPPKARTY